MAAAVLCVLLLSACASSGPAAGPSAAAVFDSANCSTWLKRLPSATAFLLNTWQEEHRQELNAGRGQPDVLYAEARRAIERTCAHLQANRSFEPYRSALALLSTEKEEPAGD